MAWRLGVANDHQIDITVVDISRVLIMYAIVRLGSLLVLHRCFELFRCTKVTRLNGKVAMLKVLTRLTYALVRSY